MLNLTSSHLNKADSDISMKIGLQLSIYYQSLGLGFQRQQSCHLIPACSFLHVLHGGLHRGALHYHLTLSPHAWTQRVPDRIHLQLAFRPGWVQTSEGSRRADTKP